MNARELQNENARLKELLLCERLLHEREISQAEKQHAAEVSQFTKALEEN